jgi:transposase InsO family protein
MAWKAMDVQDQRVRFVVAASRREKPLGALCCEFGISRPTGALWIRRYAESGLEGICELSRRPHTSPAQTPWEQEERVIALRLEYPDWGARKLQVLLEGEGVKLTRSTIHRILLRYDLVDDRDRHAQAVKRFQRERPNELWQMDFKGPKNWPHAIGPLSVIDDCSRYLVALAATGKLDGGLVREQLEQAFEGCGVPEAMLMDHGTPWWNWQSFSGRTHLSLWMMRQGIRLCWSGVRHPQTQGKVERFHGSLQRALDRRGGVGSQPQTWLDAFRSEYNQVRPHEALGMRTPASIWQPSPRNYNPNPPSWEYPQDAWVLKVDCQGTVDLRGRRWRIGKTLAGERVMIQPVEGRFLVFFCSTLVREIDPSMQRSTIVERCIETPS